MESRHIGAPGTCIHDLLRRKMRVQLTTASFDDPRCTGTVCKRPRSAVAVTFTASPAVGIDLLTRTTLQIDASLPAPTIAQAIRALQRVPGVLLAELNSASTQATVAHDCAVTAGSLLAAAGVQARIVADTRAPTLDVEKTLQLAAAASLRRFMAVATAVFFGLAVVDLLVPDGTVKSWLGPLLIWSLWLFFIAEAVVRRRH